MPGLVAMYTLDLVTCDTAIEIIIIVLIVYYTIAKKELNQNYGPIDNENQTS